MSCWSGCIVLSHTKKITLRYMREFESMVKHHQKLELKKSDQVNKQLLPRDANSLMTASQLGNVLFCSNVNALIYKINFAVPAY